MNRFIEINLDALSEEIGIDKESVAELLQVFCSEIQIEMQRLKEQCSLKEWAGLQKTVHSIKGVSANLYLKDMLEATEVLDMKLKRNEYTDIQENLNTLVSVFEATIASIKRALNI